MSKKSKGYDAGSLDRRLDRLEAVLDDESDHPEPLSDLTMPSLTPSLDDIEQRQRHSTTKTTGKISQPAKTSRRLKSDGDEHNISDDETTQESRVSAERSLEGHQNESVRQGSTTNSEDFARPLPSRDAQPSRQNNGLGLMFLLVIVAFSALGYLFYQGNESMKLQNAKLHDQIQAYEQRLNAMGMSLVSVGSESVQSEQVIEQQLKSLTRDFATISAQVKTLAPNVKETERSLSKIQVTVTDMQKEASTLKALVEKQSNQLLGFEKQRLKNQELLKTQLLTDLEQAVQPISEALALLEQQVKQQVKQQVSDAEAESVKQKAQIDSIEKTFAQLEQTLPDQDTQEAIDALSLELLQLQGSFEKELSQNSASIKSINLFRRQIMGDIEQIKNEIRDFKNSDRDSELYREPLSN